MRNESVRNPMASHGSINNWWVSQRNRQTVGEAAFTRLVGDQAPWKCGQCGLQFETREMGFKHFMNYFFYPTTWSLIKYWLLLRWREAAKYWWLRLQWRLRRVMAPAF